MQGCHVTLCKEQLILVIKNQNIFAATRPYELDDLGEAGVGDVNNV